MECKTNKWDCEEGRGGGCLWKGKVRIGCLDGDKIVRKWRISWCGVNGIIAGVQEMERSREGVAVLLDDVA